MNNHKIECAARRACEFLKLDPHLQIQGVDPGTGMMVPMMRWQVMAYKIAEQIAILEAIGEQQAQDLSSERVLRK